MWQWKGKSWVSGLGRHVKSLGVLRERSRKENKCGERERDNGEKVKWVGGETYTTVADWKWKSILVLREE